MQILQAMIALRGVYERHQVVSLNHGVGFSTAAIELILPTYGEQLGLKGKICRNWALNPHPTLIPAIESGWVESVHSFGGESGMNRLRRRPAGRLLHRRRRVAAVQPGAVPARRAVRDRHVHRLHAADGRARRTPRRSPRAGCPGSAARPNMGHDPHGRRHATPAWLDLQHGDGAGLRGRKLVVQIAETFQSSGTPTFVESLDAVEVGKDAGMPLPPVMIYGDDVSHVVTEEGVAYLYKAPSLEDRQGRPGGDRGRDAARAAARTRPALERLRRDGLVAFPPDLKVDPSLADRSLLAARSIGDLVAWSGGPVRAAGPVPGLVNSAPWHPVTARCPEHAGRSPAAVGRRDASADSAARALREEATAHAETRARRPARRRRAPTT